MPSTGAPGGVLAHRTPRRRRAASAAGAAPGRPAAAPRTAPTAAKPCIVACQPQWATERSNGTGRATPATYWPERPGRARSAASVEPARDIGHRRRERRRCPAARRRRHSPAAAARPRRRWPGARPPPRRHRADHTDGAHADPPRQPAHQDPAGPRRRGRPARRRAPAPRARRRDRRRSASAPPPRSAAHRRRRREMATAAMATTHEVRVSMLSPDWRPACPAPSPCRTRASLRHGAVRRQGPRMATDHSHPCFPFPGRWPRPSFAGPGPSRETEPPCAVSPLPPRCCAAPPSPRRRRARPSAGPMTATSTRWIPTRGNETFLLAFNANIYEPLVRRNRQMQPEPALAARWEQPSPDRLALPSAPRTCASPTARPSPPTTWCSPSARARAGLQHRRRARHGEGGAQGRRPHGGLRDHRARTRSCSRRSPTSASCRAPGRSGTTRRAAADLTTREENFATRNAMGTGPFLLVSREPDRRTVLAPNPSWWDTPSHNLDARRVQRHRQRRDARRRAALGRGRLGLHRAAAGHGRASRRTPGLRIIQGPELRTIYLGMDQLRPELLKSDVRGRNPFQDVRVRRPSTRRSTSQAIQRTVMRGQSRPTGLMIGPGVNGFVEADDRAPAAGPRRRAPPAGRGRLSRTASA